MRLASIQPSATVERRPNSPRFDAAQTIIAPFDAYCDRMFETIDRLGGAPDLTWGTVLGGIDVPTFESGTRAALEGAAQIAPDIAPLLPAAYQALSATAT